MTALKKILITIAIVILVFFIGFLSYTFYLMKTSNGNHLTMFVNLEKDILANNVRNDFPERDGNKIIYSFPIRVENISDAGDSIVMSLSPAFSAKSSTDTFEYSLPKGKYQGRVALSEIESGTFAILKLEYNIPQDVRYFAEYSICTVKKIYSDMFKLDLSCSRGNCEVNRNVYLWTMEIPSTEVAEKVEYFESFDKEDLINKLTYFFMTDDFGYFNPTSFRFISGQISRRDGTFSFASNFVTNAQEAKTNLPVVFTLLSGVSVIYDSQTINIPEYIENISSYISTANYGEAYFQNCKVSSYIITNLKECNTNGCISAKNHAYEYCKQTLDQAMKKYDSTANTFSGYTKNSILRGYLFGISSEMIEFNKIADLMESSDTRFTDTEILSYYQKGKTILAEKGGILPHCYQMRSAKDIYSEYPNDSLILDMELLYPEIQKIHNICDTDPSNPYCEVTMAEKLICAESLLGYRTNEAKNLLADIFYRHYFESPGSSKIVTYENWRFSPFSNNNPKSLQKLSEYGYFTIIDTQEEYTTHSANISDSYYFINLLKRFSNE